MKHLSRVPGLIVALLLLTFGAAQSAAFDVNRLLGGLGKVVQASSISDEEMAAYVHQYVTEMDKKNKVAPANSPYTIRLAKLTEGLTDVDGIPLNFKVYMTQDVNAFACADGSVRVYSGLMDLMDDDEVLGVIGHEIGHVAHKDTKKAFQNALMTSALKDGLASTSSGVARLTDSQLGRLGEALSSSQYSQKQESQADDYGYDFLKSHGKNPYAMVKAFTKLQTIETQNGVQVGGMAKLFSDHPDTGKRIANIEKRCKKDGYGPGTSATSQSNLYSDGSTAPRKPGSRQQGSQNTGKQNEGNKTEHPSFTLTPATLPTVPARK